MLSLFSTSTLQIKNYYSKLTISLWWPYWTKKYSKSKRFMHLIRPLVLHSMVNTCNIHFKVCHIDVLKIAMLIQLLLNSERMFGHTLRKVTSFRSQSRKISKRCFAEWHWMLISNSIVPNTKRLYLNSLVVILYPNSEKKFWARKSIPLYHIFVLFLRGLAHNTISSYLSAISLNVNYS